jgi:hypothetical protein
MDSLRGDPHACVQGRYDTKRDQGEAERRNG